MSDINTNSAEFSRYGMGIVSQSMYNKKRGTRMRERGNIGWTEECITYVGLDNSALRQQKLEEVRMDERVGMEEMGWDDRQMTKKRFKIPIEQWYKRVDSEQEGVPDPSWLASGQGIDAQRVELQPRHPPSQH